MILRTSAAWLTASISKTLIAPDVGKSRVLMMRRAVVFPAPLGPMSPYISPCVMLKVSPSNARMLPNCLTRDFASTARVNCLHLCFLDFVRGYLRLCWCWSLLCFWSKKLQYE